jgi:transposase
MSERRGFQRNWTCPDCGTRQDRDVNAAKNIYRFATGGEPGIARGLGKNLSDHVSGTKVETRTEPEKFDEAVRLERAA